MRAPLPRAQLERSDTWKADWSAYDLAHALQRPESTLRAISKARAELRPGAWLVSLVLQAVGPTPVVTLQDTRLTYAQTMAMAKALVWAHRG